eukprot:459040-Pleurochrysis_carterae.AAC.2
MSAFSAFINSPVGPKTTHFWGPLANWGFVISGLADMNKPSDMISRNMTGGTGGAKMLIVPCSVCAALCIYSCLFMRFAWAVQPRNYLLLACHMSNFTVQVRHLPVRLTADCSLRMRRAPNRPYACAYVPIAFAVDPALAHLWRRVPVHQSGACAQCSRLCLAGR